MLAQCRSTLPPLQGKLLDLCDQWAMAAVFQICRHVVSCDDRQALLTTTMILLTTGSFCLVCDFLNNFENRTIIDGDMTQNVQVGKQILVLEKCRPVQSMKHCLLLDFVSSVLLGAGNYGLGVRHIRGGIEFFGVLGSGCLLPGGGGIGTLGGGRGLNFFPSKEEG